VAEQHKISVVIGLIAGIIGVIATLLTLPYWAGNLASDVAEHARRLEVQRSDINDLQKDVSCLKVDVKGIQADMSWVRMATERLLDLQTKHYKMSEASNKLLKSGIVGEKKWIQN
jgi:hypothetical protein